MLFADLVDDSQLLNIMKLHFKLWKRCKSLIDNRTQTRAIIIGEWAEPSVRVITSSSPFVRHWKESLAQVLTVVVWN